MNIGYGTNGGLTDRKTLSNGLDAPVRDATSFYLWTILCEFQKRGCNTYRLVKDTMDCYAIDKYGLDAFTYQKQIRRSIYNKFTYLDFKDFEKLDLVIWEWRWPILGRNTLEDKGKPGYCDDYENQCKFFNEFSRLGIPVFVFDQDYKLTKEDLKNYPCIKGVLDYGTKWANTTDIGIYVDMCFSVDCLNIYEVQPSEDYCVYIGNRYERDRCIDKYLADGTHVYGNWLEHGYDSKSKWPQFVFCPRVQPYAFQPIYSKALGVPLLAKDSYCQHGFMTARLLESVFYGALPLFIEEFSTNWRFCPPNLRKWLYIHDNSSYVKSLQSLTFNDKKEILAELKEHLQFTDASIFVDTVLSRYNDLS